MILSPPTQDERLRRYEPILFPEDGDGGVFHHQAHPFLQSAINDTPSVEYCRTSDGKVWRIRRELNKKSVPLNDGSAPSSLTRLAYDKVISFGKLRDEADLPEPNPEIVEEVRKLRDEGITVQVDLAPGGGPKERIGTHIKAAANAVDAEAAEAPQADAEPTSAPESTEEPGAAPAHAERAHALLSASSAHRWLNCTPAPHLEARYPDVSSPAAEEGTVAHEWAEHKLLRLHGHPSEEPAASEWFDDDMDSHTDDYADHVMAELQRAKQTSPAAFLAIEQRLDFSHIVPDGFGTGDALIVADDVITVVDFKYGKGVRVDAQDNPQMMLYALGALHQFGMIYPIKRVRMVIFQPRMDNISVAEIDVDELKAWAEEVVKPTAQEAMAGEGELAAGSWCQFCKHAPQCPALAAQHFTIVPHEAGESAPAPDTLTDEQTATILTHGPDLKKWIDQVKKHAEEKARGGHAYPGMKLVEGRSVRRYADENQVAQAVQEAGEDPWKPRELLGITAMTKLLGKPAFDQLVAEHLVKPEGAPTLVPASDKRPEITPTTPENVFTPIEESA